MKKFIFLEHTADIKFQAFGKSLDEVFKNCALATAKSMFPEKVKKKIVKKINVNGNDKESLLYNFLDEIVYLFDADNFLLSDIKSLKIIDFGKKLELFAEIIGDNSRSYKIKEHIKSVTYSEMFVKYDFKNKKWAVQVVVDV